jgi:hypothetical protein
LPGFLQIVLIGGAANVVIQILNAKVSSFPKGEVSYALPLQSMTPLLITIAALLGGELPGFREAIGVVIMVTGSYVLTFDKVPERWWYYLMPFWRVILIFKLRTTTNEKVQEERQKAIVTAMALGSATMGTIGLLADGIMVRRGVTLQGAILASTMLTAILAGSYTLWYFIAPDSSVTQREVAAKSPFISQVRVFAFVTVTAFAACWVAHIYLIQPRYDDSYIAYVGTLKRLNAVIAVPAGLFFFREGSFGKRFFAAILIVIGATLISSGALPSHLSARIEEWGF